MVTDASDTAAAAQASFDAIAGQIKAASHDAADADAPAGAVAARLDAIEQAQERLAEELEVVRLQLARAHLNGKGREVVAEDEEGAGGPPAALQKTLEELAGKVDKLGDTVKMDQQRLYIRMQNATVNTKKGAIKAPPTVNGKPPPNFPATKGEFEHMTKERYEGIMKAYDMPLKGDTEVKREALRQFLGLGPMQ